MVPADFDVSLRLTFFELPVIVGFKLDQRLEDLSVLFGVAVTKQEGLLLNLWLNDFKILDIR